MRLVVLCPHFEPDTAPTGEVMTRIVHELAARGHHIDVVTALPWYSHHRVEDDWRGRPVRTETTPWGRVVRVHPFPTDKTDIPRRALGFLGFSALVGLRGLGSLRKVDGVLAMSPPLTLGLTGWAVALARRAPLVFNIQDVFPDVAIEVGVLRSPRLIRFFRWLERTSYAAADAVTVLSDDLRDNLAAKVRRAEKIRVIPNFVDTAFITPRPRATAYRRELGIPVEATVVLYAGNIGYSQSLDLVIDAAVALQSRPDVVFLVNGSGSARAEIEARAAGLANVRFGDLQPRERLPEVLATGDIHVVPLKRGLARSSVPSKTYSVLAAGRPLVASVDPGTEVERIVTRAGCGTSVAPDDRDGFVRALTHLVDHPDERDRLGASGRRWVEAWASPAAVAEQYEQLFRELG